MAFRSGKTQQEFFGAFLASPPKNETLIQVKRLIDWKVLRAIMAPVYKDASRGGRPGFDPVMMFKLLLLEQWYGLSDVRVVEEAADRLSFRSFLGIGTGDRVPDDSSLVRFRKRLLEADLLDALYAEVIIQMNEQGLGIEPGSMQIVDATLIKAAPAPPSKGTPEDERLDPDADFTVKNGKPHYGYKLHLAQDRETGLVTGHATTAASVHDSQVFEELIEGSEPAEVYADKAYDSRENRRVCHRLGARPRLMRRARPGKPLSGYHQRENRKMGRVRSFIEGTNATLKRFMRCGRAVYIGMEKVHLQLTFGVLAYNLRRYVALSQG